jgi:NOL1/NOP2/fmu family ribosome biogenesis protein
MIDFKILSDKEKNEIIKKLSDTYGLHKEDIEGKFVMIGRDKARLFTSSIGSDELESLKKILNIELIGTYLCKIEQDGIRLSHDSANLFKEKITKNILEIDDKQASAWLRGEDVLTDIKDKHGFFIIKNRGEIIGCGKIAYDGRIRNFVPKSRRVKS